MEIDFRLLNTWDDRIAIFPLYNQLNPRISEDVFKMRMLEMMQESGYYLIAGYLEQELVCASGYWISHKLYCGKYLEPDNVVTDSRFRSVGIGTLLQKKLEEIAVASDCRVMMLDAYLDNQRGHQFYEQHGYVRKGYHFIKKL